MIQVPEGAIHITDDTVTINLKDVAVFDQFQFPTGKGHVPATVSFNATYTKSGMPRRVRPKTHDPLSPFNWEGEMWTATNSGSFSLAYNNGKFSAQGTFSSSGNFGEIGMERNGSFVDREGDNAETELLSVVPDQVEAEGRVSESANKALSSALPLLKGRVPIKLLPPPTVP